MQGYMLPPPTLQFGSRSYPPSFAKSYGGHRRTKYVNLRSTSKFKESV
jgi:hypothetical protein